MRNYEYFELYFTTATIKNWRKLLQLDKYKDIITKSLSYLVHDNSVRVYAFVIMPNHIHIVWQILQGHELQTVRQRLLKYTAQQIKFDLLENHPKVLDIFKSERHDRAYQFWKSHPLSILLLTEPVVKQKMDYVHRNPTTEKWRLAESPSEYHYSSCSFYTLGEKKWDFLTNFYTDEQSC